MPSPDNHKIYRFATFEVDPDAGEVRKRGIRIKVQEKPFRLLSALLEHPGTLVTREELHNRLWPDDTFVDFEHGLNTAVTRLRQALGDSAQTPRYIESLPRRGYRFIAAVETESTDPGQQIAPERAASNEQALALGSANERRTAMRPGIAAKPWIVASVFFLIAVIVSWIHFRERPRVDRPFKFSLPPPEGTTFAVFDPIAISPDGRLMAFPAKDSSGEVQLWVRPLDTLEPRRLDGTNGASFPFWSPDSRMLGFFAEGKLKTVDSAGGTPRAVCEAVDGRGGSWNRDGVIVLAPGLKSALFQVPSTGGQPKPVTTLAKPRQELSHRWPVFLPDGRHFLYLSRTAKPDESGIYVGSIMGATNSLLLRSMSEGAYAREKSGRGYLMFMHGSTLVGQPFDASRMRLTGGRFPIAESVRAAEYMEPLRAEFSVSDAGVLVYQTGRGTDRLTWFDRDGIRLGTIGEPGVHLAVSLSPGDREVGFSQMNPRTGRFDVWRIDRESGMSFRVTYGPEDEVSPVWSPDGSHMAYSSLGQGGAGDLYETSSRGGGEKKLLLKSGQYKLPVDWAPNGRFLLYQEIHSGRKMDTWALPMPDGGRPVALLQTPFDERAAIFSPDGKWLAYSSDETGRLEIYVTPFSPAAPSTRKWMVSTDGGSHPKWPGDGKQLYYLAPDKRIMVAAVSTKAGFRSGAPRALFQSDIIDDFRARFAVTADGQRFLIPSAAGQAISTPATVVVNWLPGSKE